jgi:outer membrane protein TolC
MRRPLLCSVLPLLLASCAQFSTDGGISKVSALAGQPVARIQTTQDAQLVQDSTNTLLAAPLTADAAVQIALLNNRDLQASLSELGISEADLVRAGRLPNPFISFSRLSGNGVEIERAIGFDFLSVLTMPARIKIERQRFEQVQQRAALQAVSLAANTRRAFFNAVAAAETERYLLQVEQSAAAGAELALEMKKAGNWSALDAMRQQAFHAETVAQRDQAAQVRLAAHEELTQLLGLENGAAIQLPARLPDLPLALQQVAQPEQHALEHRLDVQIARSNALALADALGLSRDTALVDAIRLTYKNKSVSGEPRADGVEASLMLPLFDWTGSKNKRAEALYMQAVHQSADVAVRARSEVRTALAARQTAHSIARHYRDTVVPLRKQIADETLLRYNGMLIGVFELLVDARSQMQAVNGSILAVRDYWIAESGWQMALSGGSAPSGMTMRVQPLADAPAGH